MIDLQLAITWMKMYRGSLLTILARYNTLISLFSASGLPQEHLSTLELLRNELKDILANAVTLGDRLSRFEIDRNEIDKVANHDVSDLLKFYYETKKDFPAISLSFQDEVERDLNTLDSKYVHEITQGLETIKTIQRETIILLDTGHLFDIE